MLIAYFLWVDLPQKILFNNQIDEPLAPTDPVSDDLAEVDVRLVPGVVVEAAVHIDVAALVHIAGPLGSLPYEVHLVFNFEMNHYREFCFILGKNRYRYLIN